MVSPNNLESPKVTQADLAKQLGMSVDTLRNYKLLSEMIPELEDLLDTGIVTKTTALAIMRNLSVKEQVCYPLSNQNYKRSRPIPLQNNHISNSTLFQFVNRNAS